MVKEAEIDALYSTPPADFVAARNALVQRARAAKRDDLARELAALRKPSRVVWLVNQLARRHPADAAALIAAGTELRQAQRSALRGAGTAALRNANQGWRAAVSKTLKRIREIAGGAIEEPRIVATLLGAAADPRNAKRLERGRLDEELEPPGIESALGAIGKAPALRTRGSRRARPVQANAVRRGELRAERRRAREATRTLRAREREATKAQKAAADAERTAVRLEERGAEAVKRAGDAHAAARAAKRRAAELEAEVERLRASRH